MGFNSAFEGLGKKNALLAKFGEKVFVVYFKAISHLSLLRQKICDKIEYIQSSTLKQICSE